MRGSLEREQRAMEMRERTLRLQAREKERARDLKDPLSKITRHQDYLGGYTEAVCIPIAIIARLSLRHGDERFSDFVKYTAQTYGVGLPYVYGLLRRYEAGHTIDVSVFAARSSWSLIAEMIETGVMGRGVRHKRKCPNAA